MQETAGAIRTRARAALRRAILDAALDQLATTGADGLSVRQVARQVGLASSAIYRYVPSRDALLTELILAGYDQLGEAAEQAEAGCDRGDLRGRFAATARAVRSWGAAHPHHYALLYGSPVPGYAAPEETAGPASRVPLVLSGILRDAAVAGAPPPPRPGPEPDSGILEPEVLTTVLAGVAPRAATEAVLVWASLFGVVSFELFGHFVGSVADADRFFEAALGSLMDRLALPG